MPITLHVSAEPPRRRFVDTPSAVPAWQLVHRAADNVYPELRAVWQTVFGDLQDALPSAALQEALASGNLFAVEQVFQTAWHEVQQQARAVLPALLQDAMRRVAQALVPDLEETADVTIGARFNVINDESLQFIQQYIGEQIVSIGETTLLGVRHVVRSIFVEGKSITQAMDDLETLVGLTPRQQETIQGLRERLEAEGLSEAQVQQQVEQAAARALRLRVENIARTESMAASNAGAHELQRQAVQEGLLDGSRVRRYWLLTPDRRLCQRCASVPGRNAEGVGLNEPFQTPGGEVMYPPLHSQCRCTVNTRVV